ncbi:hypothetical protein [Corynebacterium auriscanis]|uniref:hypothetical protein n=1 Tax=Corynebacterium auriscanis TaxID=99807 RepID=UPI003CF6BBE1
MQHKKTNSFKKTNSSKNTKGARKRASAAAIGKDWKPDDLQAAGELPVFAVCGLFKWGLGNRVAVNPV